MCRRLFQNGFRAALGLLVGLSVCGSIRAEDFATIRISDRNTEIVVRGPGGARKGHYAIAHLRIARFFIW